MREIVRVLSVVALAGSLPGQLAPFRSSLTATVIIPPAIGDGKARSPAAAALGCRDVILRWAGLPGSKRYMVYVSARIDGPWAQLPESNVCGGVRWSRETGVTDVEPTAGAPAVVHHLYYKVIALAGTAAGSPALDVTEPVSVELP